MLVTSVLNNFNEIKDLLAQLSAEEFTLQHPELSNATIGEHIRHIIELYDGLVKSYPNGIVNYDLRERNTEIQTNINFALLKIENLIKEVNKPNKDMKVVQGTSETLLSIDTNYFRELLYNLEHSIHHQALIKVALFKINRLKIDENFGVARSTIEYRLQCAQ